MGNRTRIEYVIDGKNKTKKVFAEVNADLSRSGNSVKRFNKNMSTGVDAMKRYSAVIGTAVVASSVLFVKKTLDIADGLAKMSQRVGVTVEDLSTLRHVAELSGTGIETFEKAIAKQSKGLLDAQLGLKESKEAYEMLGISIFNSGGKLRATSDVLLDVADKFSTMADSGKKTALAIKIFGRSGTELIPMLNQGASGISAMQQEARKLGLEISTNFAKDAEKFNDSMTRLEGSLTGLAYKTLPAVAESLSWLSENFVEGLNKITGATAEARANLELLSRTRYVAEWEMICESYDKGTLKHEVEQIKKELEELKSTPTVGGLLAWAGIDTDSNNTDIKKIKELEDQLKAITNLVSSVRTKVDDISDRNTNAIIAGVTAEDIKLTNEWKLQSDILKNEIIKNGLSPQSSKLFDLQISAEKLKNKYAGIAGATKLINDNLQSAIDKEFNINSEEHTPMGQAMQIFYDMGEQRGGAAFELMKGFTIAEIGMSTYLVAMSALEPPPVGLGTWGLAATIGVLGTAKAAQVASLKPGNSGSGAGMSRPGTSLPGSTVDRSNTNNTTNNTSKNINIYIEGDVVDVDGYVRDKIIPSLHLAEVDGYDLNIGRG